MPNLNMTILRTFLTVLMAFPNFLHAQPFPGGGGVSEVGVMALTETDVPFTTTLPGRASAMEQTEIRPRVEGVIKEIAYTAGRRVEKGDLLFRLDAETYEAVLASAEAARDSADATLAAAQAAYARYAKLEGLAASTSDLESAEVSLAQAKASVKSAEADIQQAQLDLDRVEIRSPIAGIADVPQFSVGALVTANQSDALATITRLDPIYVDVSESSARRMRIREQLDKGILSPGEELDVTLTLENGVVYENKGTLVSPGVTVSTSTGAIDLRFEFDNPERDILPGQFLRVDITLGTSKAILVPQRATTRQSDGTLTAFVAEDGKAHQVTLNYSGTSQNAWIVTGGVEVGDQIILDGLTHLRDGAEITTVPVTINAAGVVEDAEMATPDAPEAE